MNNNVDLKNFYQELDEALGEAAKDLFYREEIKQQRKIVATVTLKPNDGFVELSYQVKTTLPPNLPSKTIVFIDPITKTLAQSVSVTTQKEIDGGE